jgi:hypothetical protein
MLVLRKAAVTLKYRLEIKVLVSSLDLETDPERAVSIKNQFPVTEHSMAKVRRRMIEHNHLNRPPEELFQLSFETKRQAVVSLGRRLRKQDRHIDVAPRRGRSARNTSEKIDGYETMRLHLEELLQSFFDLSPDGPG